MFDRLLVLPQQLRRVLGLVAFDGNDAAFKSNPVGQKWLRLNHDERLVPRVLLGTSADNRDQHLRERWHGLAKECRQGQADGVLWLRGDVQVDDFFLIERLAEAWAHQEVIALFDQFDKPYCVAVSRRAINTWVGTAPELPQLSGEFPKSEINALGACDGINIGAWPLALSAKGLIPRAADKPKESLLVVCATRETQERFMSHTATGQSLQGLRAAGHDIKVSVACENSASLGFVYNKVINRDNADKIIVFMHDDIHLDDWQLPCRLSEALLRFDVVGVAGSRNRIAKQPAWAFPKKISQWDDRGNLLGAVGHELRDKSSNSVTSKVSSYGSHRGTARLLDGVMLAARCSVLLQAGVQFDERFRFHFYDMDFCRSAEEKQLRVGVWPMAITHQSGGNFSGNEWVASYGSYIGKWET